MIPEEWGAQASSDDEVLGSARLVKLHCRAERRRTGIVERCTDTRLRVAQTRD